MKKLVKIGIFVIVILIFVSCYFNISNFSKNITKIHGEKVVQNCDKILFLTEGGNLYYNENNRIRNINKYFGDSKVKKIYCTLFCDYAYVILENDDIYYLEKEYEKLNSNNSYQIKQLEDETIQDVFIVNNNESRVYILTKSGKVCQHINGEFSKIKELEKYNISSLEGDSEIIFAFTNDNKLLYWSNERKWDKNISEYRYSTNVIEADKYINGSKILDIKYIRGFSDATKNKGYFVITTDEVYQIEPSGSTNSNLDTYEFYTINEEKGYVANELIKTGYVYSEKAKVKLVTIRHNKVSNSSTTYETILGEFDKYVLKIEDEGVILLNEKKVLYNEKFRESSILADSESYEEYVFEKVN